MVHHYIDHEEHIPVMDCFGERLQVGCRSKLVIELGDISDPVPMIWVTVCRPRAVIVLIDWADPNGGEAH